MFKIKKKIIFKPQKLIEKDKTQLN